MVEKVVTMIGLGIEIEGTVEVEAKEMIVECPDVMLGATTTIDHQGGIETFSRVVWKEIEVVAVVHHPGVIEMSLQCKWAAEKRAQALLQRRRSLRLI